MTFASDHDIANEQNERDRHCRVRVKLLKLTPFQAYEQSVFAKVDDTLRLLRSYGYLSADRA